MIVVIGKNGQLAQELSHLLSQDSAIFLGREDISLLDYDSLTTKLDTLAPTAIINASAYTAVDKAESQKEEAFALNGTAVKHLADYSVTRGCFLVHVSTDYVFDGKHYMPYKPDHPVAPKSVYGESKAQGEKYMQAINPSHSAILRTSWVYSQYGNNFVKTMLRLMAEKPKLGIVADQIGAPTWARGLAQMCTAVTRQKLAGIFHYSDAGVASWYDFAVAIQRIALETGLLKQEIPVHPITTEQFPTPAKRPHYSLMSGESLFAEVDVDPVHWEVQLRQCLEQIAQTRKD